MRVFTCLLVCLLPAAAGAGEAWQSALAGMPLGANLTELNRTNCVSVMLPALQSNNLMKALIFLPGATDELYFFRRARAALTNARPSLLDAVTALTNQTRIRATFRPPLLLLHTDEDPVEPFFDLKDPETAARLRQTKFVAHALYDDRDWDFLLPILKKTCGLDFTPGPHSRNSYHFYRHSFAAWNLNGWEALEAIALAGKSKFAVNRKQVIFAGDVRTRAPLFLESYPK
jgi:hypothetical protein